MVAAVGSYLKSWIFLPDVPVVPGPHDFVPVANPPPGYQNDECSICSDPLFNTPIDPDYPNVHKTVIAHRPRGMGVNAPLNHHIHLECLELELRQRRRCPTCRGDVTPAVVRAIPRNVPPSPPPTLANRVRWISREVRDLGNRVISGMQQMLFETLVATGGMVAFGVLTAFVSEGVLALMGTVFSSLKVPLLVFLLPTLASYSIGGALSALVPFTIFNIGYSLLIENRRLTVTARVVVLVALTALASIAAMKLSILVGSSLSLSYLQTFLSPAQMSEGLKAMWLTRPEAIALGIPPHIANIAAGAGLFQTGLPIAVFVATGLIAHHYIQKARSEP